MILERPDAVGWWWYRKDAKHEWTVVEVAMFDGALRNAREQKRFWTIEPGQWVRLNPPDDNKSVGRPKIPVKTRREIARAKGTLAEVSERFGVSKRTVTGCRMQFAK